MYQYSAQNLAKCTMIPLLRGVFRGGASAPNIVQQCLQLGPFFRTLVRIRTFRENQSGFGPDFTYKVQNWGFLITHGHCGEDLNTGN